MLSDILLKLKPNLGLLEVALLDRLLLINFDFWWGLVGRGGLVDLLRLDLRLLIVYMALYSVKACLNKMLI